MSDFKRIYEIAKVRRGASPRPIDDQKWFGGYVGWVRIVDVTRSKRYLRSTEQYLSPLGETKSVRVDKGDVIMSICATIGRPVIVDMPACIHDGFVQFYDIKSTNTEYLYYALQHAEQEFINYGQTGTQANLNTTIVGKHTLFVPPLPEQRKIARILTTVDNLIEKTEALIAKYQAIKQGMMHDLFTRGVDARDHLRPTCEEAPELYKESELGWIPKEWKTTRLDEVATVNRGKFTARPRNDPKYYGGLYPFIQTSDVTNSNGLYLETYNQTLNDIGKTVSKKFSKGTILVTIAANIADTAILGIPMYLPDSVVGVDVHHGNFVRFVELAIKRNKYSLDALATQSAQKNINLEDLRPLVIPFPNNSEQELISVIYESIESRIINEKKYLRKLHITKTGLMQDLLTGKVRVKIEKSGEAAA